MRIGGFCCDHRADLHWRCMRAEKHLPLPIRLLGEVEGIVHRPRRMALGNVERGEIVPVVLDLRPRRDREAQIGEDFRQLVHHLTDRMHRAGQRRIGRQRHVDRLGREPRIKRRALQGSLARADCVGNRLAQRVDARTFRLTLLRSHLAERLEQRRHSALFAERLDTNCLDRIEVIRRRDPPQQVASLLIEFSGHSKIRSR